MEVDRISAPDAFVIAANNGDATALYYSRRKGWHFPQESNLWMPEASNLWSPFPKDGRQAIQKLVQLRRLGGTYLVLSRYTFYLLSGSYREFGTYLDSVYSRVEDTDDYVIFDLRESRATAASLAQPH